MVWFHPSLEDKPDYTARRDGRILKGQTIIALYLSNSGEVLDLAGRTIGTATSGAEAMLMVIRHHEGCKRS